MTLHNRFVWEPSDLVLLTPREDAKKAWHLARAQARKSMRQQFEQLDFDESQHPRGDNKGKAWNEADHPRAPAGGPDGGQFGDGGGGGEDSAEPKVYPQGKIEDSVAELKKDSPKFFGDRTFTDDEIKAVNNYIRFLTPEVGKPTWPPKPGRAQGFEAINSNLRKNASYSTDTIKLLDAAIDKGVAPHDVKVYRGIGNTLAAKIREQWDEYGKAEFKDSAYVSTSVNKKIATNFSKNVMEITVAKGKQALPIDWNGEAEVLLGRGNKFKVTSVKRTASGRLRIKAELL